MSAYQRVLIFQMLAYVAAGIAFPFVDFSSGSRPAGLGVYLGPLFFFFATMSGFLFLTERIKGLEKELAALRGQQRPTE